MPLNVFFMTAYRRKELLTPCLYQITAFFKNEEQNHEIFHTFVRLYHNITIH